MTLALKLLKPTSNEITISRGRANCEARTKMKRLKNESQ